MKTHHRPCRDDSAAPPSSGKGIPQEESASNMYFWERIILRFEDNQTPQYWFMASAAGSNVETLCQEGQGVQVSITCWNALCTLAASNLRVVPVGGIPVSRSCSEKKRGARQTQYQHAPRNPGALPQHWPHERHVVHHLLLLRRR